MKHIININVFFNTEEVEVGDEIEIEGGEELEIGDEIPDDEILDDEIPDDVIPDDVIPEIPNTIPEIPDDDIPEIPEDELLEDEPEDEPENEVDILRGPRIPSNIPAKTKGLPIKIPGKTIKRIPSHISPNVTGQLPIKIPGKSKLGQVPIKIPGNIQKIPTTLNHVKSMEELIKSLTGK